MLQSRKHQRQPLPPGPPGLPLIGNIFDIPKSYSWKTFAEWGRRWGGIVSIKVLGQTLVIVNDPHIAIDMLEKKGTLYADRPHLPMANLCGWDHALSLTPYGARFREYRKLIARVIGTQAAMSKFHSVQKHQGIMLVNRILSNPDEIEEACRKTVGATVLDITYGYKVKEEGVDPFVHLADKGLHEFSDCTTTGKYLVDSLPVLKYAPSWFPGAEFKRIAAKYLSSCKEMAEMPLTYVREELAKGTASRSFVADLLAAGDLSAERFHNITWPAASFYGAGSDTTVTALHGYFFAMALYPDVQRRLHAEIDAAVGRGRLPEYADRPFLPYLDAVCKELLRWQPIVPIAPPHVVMGDDVHEGYFIPKGTLVLANLWNMLHDENLYPDPFIFKPERHLGENPERNPMEFCFGFGRRVCPGVHLADSSLWIDVVMAATGLTISKTVDVTGREIEPALNITDGVIVRLLPCPFKVVPRFDGLEKLVENAINDSGHTN